MGDNSAESLYGSRSSTSKSLFPASPKGRGIRVKPFVPSLKATEVSPYLVLGSSLLNVELFFKRWT